MLIPCFLRRFAGTCLIWGSLGLGAAAGQSKATLPWSGWLGCQVNGLSASGHAALLRARVERSFEADYNAYGPGQQLQRATVQVGYEWLLNERWSGGGVTTLTLDPNQTRTFYPGAFLRHCGHIGGVQFRKRAILEYVARDHQQPDAARLRLRADLDRVFRVGRTWLRPRLAYDVQFDYDLPRGTKDDPAPETRFIDHGVLRLEVALARGDHFTLVPFLTRRTDFFLAVEQRDAQNNVLVPAGARNLRFPAVGLEVRYTLAGRALAPAGGTLRDLPTFEGFQD